MKECNCLLASAVSIENINKMINLYFYSVKQIIETKDKNIFNIINANGTKLKNFRVIKIKDRYRFEQL
jgi:hypothetical protein